MREAERRSLFHLIYDRTNFSASIEHLSQDAKRISSLMWSRLIPTPWHVYKQDLKNWNLQTVRFADDAIRMLDGASLPVNGLYSIADAKRRR